MCERQQPARHGNNIVCSSGAAIHTSCHITIEWKSRSNAEIAHTVVDCSPCTLHTNATKLNLSLCTQQLPVCNPNSFRNVSQCSTGSQRLKAIGRFGIPATPWRRATHAGLAHRVLLVLASHRATHERATVSRSNVRSQQAYAGCQQQPCYCWLLRCVVSQ